MEWQPIETAPTNTCVLVFDAMEVYMDCMAVGEQDDEKNWTVADSDVDIKPTHWMPLPNPPSDV